LTLNFNFIKENTDISKIVIFTKQFILKFQIIILNLRLPSL